MVDSIEAAGLRFVGKDETGRRMEVCKEFFDFTAVFVINCDFNFTMES